MFHQLSYELFFHSAANNVRAVFERTFNIEMAEKLRYCEHPRIMQRDSTTSISCRFTDLYSVGSS